MDTNDPLREYADLLRIRRKAVRRNSIYLGFLYLAGIALVMLFLHYRHGVNWTALIFPFAAFQSIFALMNQSFMELDNRNSLELIEVILRRDERKTAEE